MIRKLTSAIAFASAFLLEQSIAFAGTTSGGAGGNIGFVKPIQNFANAFELIGAALVVIAIVTIVAAHVMHREDLGGLMRNLVFVIIGGSVILAGGAFMTQVGATTTAGLIG